MKATAGETRANIWAAVKEVAVGVGDFVGVGVGAVGAVGVGAAVAVGVGAVVGVGSSPPPPQPAATTNVMITPKLQSLESMRHSVRYVG